MYSVLLKKSVTSVKFFEDYLLAGVGGELHVYDTAIKESTNWKLIDTIEICPPQNIYGIFPSDLTILVFGGRKLALLEYSKEPLQFQIKMNCSFDDWILDAIRLKDEDIAILTANNTLHKFNIASESILYKLKNEELCILYSGKMLNNVWEELVILSGTVFQEIVVWNTCPPPASGNIFPTIHRLKGHKGVIFSVNYNFQANLIYSTSDDRSVRIWSVKFDSNEGKQNWKECRISLKLTIFSHLARVWKSHIIDRNKFISVGEDSLICIWNENGECLNQWYGHQGGGVWSVDYSKKLSLIATGGSDGAINIWPVFNIEPPSIVYQHIPSNDDTVPRSVALTCHGHLVMMTNEGKLRYYNGKHWAILKEYSSYATYCKLQVSPNRRIVALANISGNLTLCKVKKETIIEIWEGQIFEGRIFSLIWLSDILIITCGLEGELRLWELALEENGSSLKLLNKFSLPKCKERWITTALVNGQFVLCGDRGGSVHLYDLSPQTQEAPLYSIRKLHGYRGVSSIKLIDGKIISTGRDGTYRQLAIDSNIIKQIDCNKLQMEWIATVEDTSVLGPLILGFHDTNLIIWSCREGRPLLKVDCGGGHRSWDYYLDESSLKLSITFIKHKCVYNFSKYLDLLNYRTAEVGYHSKSINTACILDIQQSSVNYILTGGEDNTLRLFCWDSKTFKPQITLCRHISSIRGMYCLKDTAVDNRFLVASCGGRGQLIMWQVLECEGKIQIIESASHMVREIDNQHRNLKQIQPLTDPETRYMDVNIVKVSETRYLILAGCSDGLFRLLNFNSESNKLTLAKACYYHEFCILKVAHFIWKDLIALTMTTEGKVAFWNVNSLLNQDEICVEPVSFCIHSLGINSYSLLLLEGTLILATGSDDSTLAVNAFTLNGNNKFFLLSSWSEKTLHSCQITGVHILENYIISVALDQKISLLKWEYSHGGLVVNLVKQIVTSVPDIHGLMAWFKPECTLNVCIYGSGIQLFEYEIDLEERKRESNIIN